MGKKTKVNIRSERIVYTYSVLKDVAWNALVNARSKRSGWGYQCMSVMLFSAFCIEAYLNHLGKICVPYWDSVERRLGPKEKMEIVAHHIGYDLNIGKRPFQTFADMKRFRDWLAHGKTVKLKTDEIGYLELPDEDPEMNLAEWEKMISLENAELYFNDAKKMILELHKRAGFEEDPLFTPWTFEWEVRQLD